MDFGLGLSWAWIWLVKGVGLVDVVYGLCRMFFSCEGASFIRGVHYERQPTCLSLRYVMYFIFVSGAYCPSFEIRPLVVRV